MKNFIAFLLLAVSFVYLLNFSAGVIELPDNLPIVGNIDEAFASLVFISSLKHFGIDLTTYLPIGRKSSKPSKPQKA
jgi:hypothetical protein